MTAPSEVERACMARMGAVWNGTEYEERKPAMRILTVRQPWAWAIIHGGKDVENRVRNIAGDYRGPIAIHAGRAYDNQWDAHPLALIMNHHEGVHEEPQPWRAHLGAIIGVVDLADVHMATPDDLGAIRCQPKNRTPGAWRSVCSDWAQEANYHLELANPRPLDEPIPFRGALGLRRLDDTTTAQILAQIGDPQ